ncbi:MAG: hypothetical protein AAGM84_09365 [Pseudomonadota bacterium]
MTTATSTPRWTRIVAPIAGIWYAFGLSQMIAGYAADAAAFPGLIWAAYAAACGLGIVAAAALAFAPARAFALFAASLVCAVTFFGYSFAFTAPTGEEIGIGSVVMLITAGLGLMSRSLR